MNTHRRHTPHYFFNRIFCFTVLLTFLCSNVLADAVYFNTKGIIHIQDSCTDFILAECSNNAPHYTYTHLTTGKTDTGIAMRTPLPAPHTDNVGYEYTYIDDEGKTHTFAESGSEPLHVFYSSAFNDDYPFYSYSRSSSDANGQQPFETGNKSRLNFKLKKGGNNEMLIWLFRHNSRLNGCGDVISYNLETGEVLGDAIVFTQVCTFPDMKLQQAYAAYRKILQNEDGANDLFYTKLRAIFPKGEKRKDEFTEPEWLAEIIYSRPAPYKGRVEIFRECGESDIMIEESKKGTEIVHYEYVC